MITMVKQECIYCYGEGIQELVECDLPASMCCGGCTKIYKCDECDGVGYVYIDEDELDEY